MKLKNIDSIVILSHEMTKEGVLNSESRARADKAINYFNQGISKSIITLGWDYRIDSSIKIATAVKNYLLDNQVHSSSIIENHLSRDTVGDAFFTKLEMAKKNFKKALIITSDYHLNRTKKIFAKFFNNNFQLYYDVCLGFETDESKKSEKHSLWKFNETFPKAFYTNKEIYKKLTNEHPYYNGEIYKKITVNENFISRTIQ